MAHRQYQYPQQNGSTTPPDTPPLPHDPSAGSTSPMTQRHHHQYHPNQADLTPGASYSDPQLSAAGAARASARSRVMSSPALVMAAISGVTRPLLQRQRQVRSRPDIGRRSAEASVDELGGLGVPPTPPRRSVSPMPSPSMPLPQANPSEHAPVVPTVVAAGSATFPAPVPQNHATGVSYFGSPAPASQPVPSVPPPRLQSFNALANAKLPLPASGAAAVAAAAAMQQMNLGEPTASAEPVPPPDAGPSPPPRNRSSQSSLSELYLAHAKDPGTPPQELVNSPVAETPHATPTFPGASLPQSLNTSPTYPPTYGAPMQTVSPVSTLGRTGTTRSGPADGESGISVTRKGTVDSVKSLTPLRLPSFSLPDAESSEPFRLPSFSLPGDAVMSPASYGFPDEPPIRQAPSASSSYSDAVSFSASSVVSVPASVPGSVRELPPHPVQPTHGASPIPPIRMVAEAEAEPDVPPYTTLPRPSQIPAPVAADPPAPLPPEKDQPQPGGYARVSASPYPLVVDTTSPRGGELSPGAARTGTISSIATSNATQSSVSVPVASGAPGRSHGSLDSFAEVGGAGSSNPSNFLRAEMDEDRPKLHFPPRASSRFQSLSELMEAGAEAYQPPNQNYVGAYDTWQKAAELAADCGDHFTLVRALTNMGCCLRSLSLFYEAVEMQRAAYNRLVRFVEDKLRMDEASIWLQMAMQVFDLEASSYIDTEQFARTMQNREETMKKYLTTSRGRGRSSSLHLEENDVASGPPIVVMFMDVATNLGNAYFGIEDMEEALDWHSRCLQLAERVLDEVSLPQSFRKTVAELSTFSYYAANPALRLNARNTASQLKLSYLHRSALLAQSRSLSHIGTICQFHGLDDHAFQTQYHASSLLTYYGSRSPSFTTIPSSSSPDRGGEDVPGKGKGKAQANNGPASTPVPSTPATPSGSGPSMTERNWKVCQLDLYEASVSVNLGTALHAKGRIPGALDRLNRALALFRSLKERMGTARALSNAAALKIEIGKVLGTLHWLRNIDSQARGINVIDECRRYWGPPRLSGVNLHSGDVDESADRHGGEQWILEGLHTLNEQFDLLKDGHDINGALICLLNQAAAYVVLGNPYMALHVLSRMVCEDLGPASYIPRRVPQIFRYHTCFLMTQAFFLLTRLSRHANHDLYPGPFSDTEDGYPFFSSDPIDELLLQMDMEAVTASRPELDILMAICIEALETILRNRDENIQSRVSYAVLSTYVGVFGRTQERAMRRQSEGPSASGSREAEAEQAMTSPADDPGFWSGVDLLQQKRALLRVTGGKADWIYASRLDLTSQDGKSAYRLGTAKFDLAARETIQALVAFDTDGLGRTGSAAFRAGDKGLLASLHELIPVAIACPPASTADPVFSADNGFPSSSPPQYSSILVPPLRSSALGASALFALAADAMAFAAFQMKAFLARVERMNISMTSMNRRMADRLDLLATLRVPSRSDEDHANLHRDLMAAARAITCTLLGICENCYRARLADPDADLLVRFWGKTGIMPRSVGGAQGEQLDGGVQRFPCEHFTWLL
ncbi:hypothetical protein HDU96_005656 [Phlyctochytrium bullatum]|nr:hypothetical protein HDU96_005656 [Phlyctochytrium bullatum]